ncbi:MAG: hypothetical protein LBQ59_02510 [Candidatus Peribacteria bacterium]|nr:hypothetical protein [Candidatus Peribacteria bacterium]
MSEDFLFPCHPELAVHPPSMRGIIGGVPESAITSPCSFLASPLIEGGQDSCSQKSVKIGSYFIHSNLVHL